MEALIPISYLGRGSFGTIFKMKKITKEDSSEQEEFAVKIVIQETDRNNNHNPVKLLTKKEQREFDNLKGLKCDNVVSCYELIQTNINEFDILKLHEVIPEGREENEFKFYHNMAKKGPLNAMLIRMELCGDTLRMWLKGISTGKFIAADGRRFRICKEIMSGLKYLQRNKIVHRDLKPENIYFSNGIQLPIKIGDFGSSRIISSENSPKSGSVAATWLYAAPEIKRKKNYGFEVDVYSYGLILYEVLETCAEFKYGRKLEDVKAGEIVEQNCCNLLNFEKNIRKFTSEHDPQGRLKTFKETNLKYFLPSQTWISLADLKQNFISIEGFGQMPENFMTILKESIGVDAMNINNSQLDIRRWLSSMAVLYHYVGNTNKFNKEWNYEDIVKANKALAKFTQPNALVFKDPIVDQFNAGFSKPRLPEGPMNEDRTVKPKWSNTFGTKLNLLTYGDFLKIHKLKHDAETNDKKTFASTLPFLIQNLKMTNPNCILAEHIFDLTKTSTNDLLHQELGTTRTTSVARLDMIVGIISSVDEILGYELLRTLGQFTTSVPLFFPAICKSTKGAVEHFCTIPWLQSITIKRETKSHQMIENHLFRSQYKLVLAVRVGNSFVGKSVILNHLLSTEYMFTSRMDPGAKTRKPSCLDGSVELVWLTVENCSPVLWKFVEQLLAETSQEVLLLANLHGNVDDSHIILEALKEYVSSYLIFDFSDSLHRTKLHLANDNPIEYMAQFRRNPKPVPIINYSYIDYEVRETTSRIMANAFLNAKMHYTNSQISANIMGKKVKILDPIETEESKELLEYIRNMGLAEFKKNILQHAFDNKNNKDSIDYVDDETSWATLCRNKTSAHLLEMLMRMLQLPLRDRQKALIHLDRELTIMSSKDSKDIHVELLELKEERSKLYATLSHEQRKNNQELRAMLDNIKLKSVELEKCNLGLEHLFRVVGTMFDTVVNRDIPLRFHMNEMIRNLADTVAKGQVIEFFDGDSGKLSGKWFNGIMQDICLTPTDMKVFIVAILGLQSTGKSTLLNSMFGCRFAVSSGRCTKGLYIRILYLSEELNTTTGYDAIMLIDTEGLCAPEKMTDDGAEKRDREMATFAMLVSDLTLVNIMGETMTEMAEILQIVVVTMARLEAVEVSPDVLLVQHCQEVDKNKLQTATTEFCKAIREAIDITQQQRTALGIVNSSCLNTLVDRVESHQLLNLFHRYRDGSKANSPPSYEYYNDIKNLYNKILGVMAGSKQKVSLKGWYDVSSSYWNALQKADFSLRFRNIQEINDFIERGSRIADVIESIDNALGSHRKAIKIKIREGFVLVGRQVDIQNLKATLKKLVADMVDKTLYTCSWTDFADGKHIIASEDLQKCQCLTAVKKHRSMQKHVHGKLFQNEVNKTIGTHINKCRQLTEHHLMVYVEDELRRFKTFLDIDKQLQHWIQNHGYYNTSRKEIEESTVNGICEDLFSLSRSENPISSTNFSECMVLIRNDCVEAYKGSILVQPGWIEQISASSNSNDFRSQPAIKQTRLIKWTKHVLLDTSQATILTSNIQTFVNKLLSKVELYELRSIYKIKTSVTEILANLAKTWKCDKFEEMFTWKVHLYAIQCFCDRLELLHEKRSAVSSKAALKLILPKRVRACLSKGYTWEGEARTLADNILYTILQKAKKGAEKLVKELHLNQVWLSSVENVRLKFFDYLVGDISKGDYCNAMAYFSNPKQVITQWFVNEVDTAEFAYLKQEAGKIYNQEFSQFVRELKKRKIPSEIRKTCLHYLANVDGIPYLAVHDFNESSEKEWRMFKDELFKHMQENSNAEFEKLLFKRCSDSRSVMDRLGCTEFCYWCGALCWGHASHAGNEDITRKHHTCHQPQGLIGVSDENTGTLIANTCENMNNDAIKMVKSNGKDENAAGMTPTQIKLSKEFENWMFINHSIDDFNDVMGWFFLKLNRRIANANGKHPADEEDMKRYGYSQLDESIQSILTNIKCRLQQAHSQDPF